ncbi:LmeA family phospholipid-binding protein [Streptomyces sp. MST-110588]|uniref:LmeA family phospholipid-binding protein n=1 Tax=Streptomyces sp. MST-110588 TaxID=2833628 RepID=UPI001F5CB761|nr:LmeA family phospholipid-binding protein [Streptomyces sp. MST-110588]
MSANPYEALAALADPEPEPGTDGRTGRSRRRDPRDPLGLGLRSDDEEDEADAWQPPNHRRRKRGISRFAGVPLVVKMLVALLVCAAFLALGDRFAVLYAQDKAAEKLKESLHLNAKPEVDIKGFPFLTQVLDKRLRRVDITVPDLAADRVSLAKVEATATDIRIQGDLPSSVKGATIGQVRGTVLLAFDDMNRELGASQVRFSELGPNAVQADGRLPIAGHELRVHAQAHIRRAGDRGISTDISAMRLDIGDLAVYRPGTGKEDGLRLTRKAAAQVSREAARVKELLSVPAIARRIGIPQEYIDQALHNEHKLHELTGAPRFISQLMQVNLVDVVVDHPWLLKKFGVDPKFLGTLAGLTKPQLADQLSLSFRLPPTPGDVRLRDISVQRDGIRVEVWGAGLPIGGSLK